MGLTLDETGEEGWKGTGWMRGTEGELSTTDDDESAARGK
jgi:hypothetical protein